MKTGIYITNGSKNSQAGVDRKIDSQIHVFSEFYDMKKVIIPKKKAGIIRTIMWRMPFCSFGHDYKSALDEISKFCATEEPAFFYIRKRPFDRAYVSFLREIRKRYTTSQILLEIPTYPYDMELLQNNSMWPWYFKDKVYRNSIKKIIDRIVTMSCDDKIFGISTIHIMNGILFDTIECKRND